MDPKMPMNGESSNVLPAVEPRANPAGFDGRIRCANLADLVQFECLSNDRVAVCVRSGPREGHLFFERGELIHAASGKLTGRVAAFEILSWETGTFGPSASAWPARRTLDLPWQTLLMFAAQQRDEMLRDRSSGGASSSTSGLVPRHALRAKDERGHSEGTVRALAAPRRVPQQPILPEVGGTEVASASAARISRRGEVLGVRGDGGKLAGIGRELRQIADSLTAHLGLEGFSGIEAELSSEQLLFFADTQESDVVLTAPRAADLAAMRRSFGGG
jgi:hypothetical protein